MENMEIEKLVHACGGTYHGDKQALEECIAGVVLDSRKVEKGYCFVATRGERVDGHNFISDVFAKGAKLVVCEYIPEQMTGNFILVKDSFQALRDMAEYYRSTLSIPIVGITGSVGKTSTKEFIAGVLAQKYHVLKTEGNFNNEIGVPLTLLRIRKEHELAVVEMGINHFGEMRRLSKMVRPDVCVMTNIGECHLEFLESRAGVLRAKSEIFEYMQDGGTVFVNGDDDMLQTIGEVKGRKPERFGIDPANDYYASDIVSKGLMGSEALISMKNENGERETFKAQIHLPGEHMVRNALAATAVAKCFRLTTEEIAAGIAEVMPVGGRSNLIQCGKMMVIDDCYNANPVSMKAAIDLLCTADGDRVAILGDMGELGEKEELFHKEIGAYAVSKKITGLICIGRLARFMFENAGSVKEETGSVTELGYYETLDAFLESVPGQSFLKKECTVLVKASHSMCFSKIVDVLKQA